MQIFDFRDSHLTTFRQPSGAYICQMPGHRVSRLAKGTPSESQLSIGTIDLGKTISCRLCAGQSKGTIKTRKMLLLDLAPPTLQNTGIFRDSSRPHLHFDGFPRNRGDLSFLYRTLGALQVLQKHSRFVWPGATHPPIAV